MTTSKPTTPIHLPLSGLPLQSVSARPCGAVSGFLAAAKESDSESWFIMCIIDGYPQQTPLVFGNGELQCLAKAAMIANHSE